MEPEVHEQYHLAFPKRPQPSTKFKATPIELRSNHFTISFSDSKSLIYLYHVEIIDFEPENQSPCDARALKESILRSASQQLKALFGFNYWVSGSVLWSVRDLVKPKMLWTADKGRNYVIVLRRRRKLKLSEVMFQDNEIAAHVRQYFNIITQRYFKLTNFREWEMNAKYVDWEHREEVEQYPLAICKGFKTSCKIDQNFVPKLSINCMSRIVHTKSVLYYIRHLKANKKSDQEIRELLQGRSVVALYGNFKRWQIDDIDFNSNEESEFEVEDNLGGKKVISYLDYYKTRYNIEIKNPQPALLVIRSRKTGKKYFLVPELVQLTGFDDDMREDRILMKQVTKAARLDPNERMKKIQSEVEKLAIYYNKNYGITMNLENYIDGLVLPGPELKFGSSTFVPKKGNFNLKEPIFRPKDIENWVFIYPDSEKHNAEEFLRTLRKCSEVYAIRVLEPSVFRIKNKNSEALKEVLRNEVREDTGIVVCLYPPAAKKDWYRALKEVCYLEKGVPCQAVLTSTLKKHLMSVCSKILLQMNAKMGAELWVSQKPEGLPEKAMVIGASIYHQTKVGEEKKSCIGFCASLNPHFSKFFSRVHFQERAGDVIMTSIGRLVKEAVLRYFVFNDRKFLPECIIFFRDGLGDSQLRSALEIEVQSILDQLKTINPDYNPRLAEIVVNKRHDDRVFATEEEIVDQDFMFEKDFEGEQSFNPPAGTIVARDIVSNNFDYLVVPQQVTQGTCTPTHFNVIYDSTGLSQDVFWQLSYWQTYNYFNCNGSVRVPAPVQYAHKLAYLAGHTVQGEVDNRLEESLYYL